jgi:hypothetical protein
MQEGSPGKAPCIPNSAPRDLARICQRFQVFLSYAEQLSGLNKIKDGVLQLTADDPGPGCREWPPGDILAFNVEMITHKGGQHVSLGKTQPRSRTI